MKEFKDYVYEYYAKSEYVFDPCGAVYYPKDILNEDYESIPIEWIMGLFIYICKQIDVTVFSALIYLRTSGSVRGDDPVREIGEVLPISLTIYLIEKL